MFKILLREISMGLDSILYVIHNTLAFEEKVFMLALSDSESFKQLVMQNNIEGNIVLSNVKKRV